MCLWQGLQVFSKETKHAFEEEYRTHKFYPQPATVADRRIKLPKDCYKEIIFGTNQSKVHKQEIISICKAQELIVEFFMETIHSNNEITIEKIQSHKINTINFHTYLYFVPNIY